MAPDTKTPRDGSADSSTSDNPEATPRHGRERFFVEGEGLVGAPGPPDSRRSRSGGAAQAAEPDFRFSRIGPTSRALPEAIRRKVAKAMTAGVKITDGSIPAGYTYLGQFVDHDLTFDKTVVTLGDAVSPADMLQGRSPTLDLDSLYGAGPTDPVSAKFYADDRHLLMGKTVRVGGLRARAGFDLPRRGDDSPGKPRRTLIPDRRNDENLAVAQTHLAMIRFHNRVVDTLTKDVPAAQRFSTARRRVVLHYQWMLRTDFLPRICEKSVVTDVFRHGRRIHEVGAAPLSMPTMPVEFSVAAYRFGHSMVRAAYDWNAVFDNGGGTLDLLFGFSGTSGFLGGGSNSLPSNWIADWRRLYPFASVGRPDLKPPPGEFNRAQRIDTLLTNPLRELPPGSFAGTDADLGTLIANLAFRNLTRAGMVELATGQQMAAHLRSKGVAVKTLTAKQLAGTGDGAVLDDLSPTARTRFLSDTPLWFYILREAELNNGRLTGVGARIVAETFHRAMEGSRHSIVRNADWRPNLSGTKDRFTMMDLLIFAFEDNKDLLAPLGD
jgi:Animal haem peroxidase